MSNNITVRLMAAADYDAVYALWQRTPGMGLNAADDSQEGITRYLVRNPATCFVAILEGAIIGAILCGHDGRRGMIYHTAVDLAHRGQGIGTLLVDRAMQALEAEGIHKAALVVFASNAGGNAFWEELGFAIRGDLIYRNRSIHELERIDT